MSDDEKLKNYFKFCLNELGMLAKWERDSEPDGKKGGCFVALFF
jgi:hypothetical protein